MDIFEDADFVPHLWKLKTPATKNREKSLKIYYRRHKRP